MSLLVDTPATARVTAAERLRALVLEREAFERFLSTHPDAALRLYRLIATTMGKRVGSLTERLLAPVVEPAGEDAS